MAKDSYKFDAHITVDESILKRAKSIIEKEEEERQRLKEYTDACFRAMVCPSCGNSLVEKESEEFTGVVCTNKKCIFKAW